MPKTAAAFEHFLQHTTSDAQAVFILGDLFEYWVGDDMVEQAFVQHILSCMRAQTTANTQRTIPLTLYIMQGNRDFLLGTRFTQQAGAHLLPDPYLLNAFGQPIALSHGDALCTADRAYQRFRRLVRRPWVQRLFLAFPLCWRLGLAQWIRAQSEKARHRRSPRIAPLHHQPSPQEDPKDVTVQAVKALLKQTGARILIHGHTHRPAHHVEGIDHRWVLSDWDFEDTTKQQRGGYIRLDENGIQAIKVNAQ